MNVLSLIALQNAYTPATAVEGACRRVDLSRAT